MFGRRRKILTKELQAVVAAFSEHLPQATLDSAEDLIRHGEYGEALDLICTQVYEYEVPVTAETYSEIERCGQRMDMDDASWGFLQELLVEG